MRFKKHLINHEDVKVFKDCPWKNQNFFGLSTKSMEKATWISELDPIFGRKVKAFVMGLKLEANNFTARRGIAEIQNSVRI